MTVSPSLAARKCARHRPVLQPVCAGGTPCGLPDAGGVASDFRVGRYWCAVFQQSVRSRCPAQLAPLLRPCCCCALASLVASVAAGAREAAAAVHRRALPGTARGPGRGYAVTQVVPRGDAIDVLYRRTEWFRVRTERGIEGWAHQRDMLKTLLADGSRLHLRPGRSRRLSPPTAGKLGVLAGDYGGATLVSRLLSRSFNEQLAVEFTASQFLGNASNGYTPSWGSHMCSAPDWRAVAVRDAGHRHDLDPAQGHAGAAGRPHRPDRLCRGRPALLLDQTVLRARPNTGTTWCSPAATRMRRSTNGNSGSRSSSDARCCCRCASAAAPRCMAMVRPRQAEEPSAVAARRRRRRRAAQGHRARGRAPRDQAPEDRRREHRGRRLLRRRCRSRTSAPIRLTACGPPTM